MDMLDFGLAPKILYNLQTGAAVFVTFHYLRFFQHDDSYACFVNT